MERRPNPMPAIGYADPTSIIVEYPVAGSAEPYAVHFPRTTFGLQQALGLLIDSPAPRAKPQTHPKIRRAEPGAVALVKKLFPKIA
jgi:hypothetical protein